jgi:type IX secretion system PorP/SprF family membrane protein
MPSFISRSTSVILFLFLAYSVKAQDPNFSQFFVSPLSLNPALTGKFNGDFRIAGNYRDQWPTINKAFVTSTLSLDLPLLRQKLNPIDTWGIGIMTLSDKSANGILSTNTISVSTSYHKGLDENGMHQIGVGFQGTFSTKRLDGTRLNFEDELDQFGGWSIPSGETVNDRNLNFDYADFSMGVLYNGSTNGVNNFYAGLSAYHLNKPRETFTGDIYYTLEPRITFNAGTALPVGDGSRKVYLSTLYSNQAGAQNFVAGAAAGLSLNDEPENPSELFLGVWTRFNNVNDAIIPYAGLEFNGIRIGASYDVNVSSLKTGSQRRGGIEVSLIYIKRKPGYKPLPCPKF